MANLTPDEVISRLADELPPGSVLTAAVAIVTYVTPGEDDEDQRGPYLAWFADQTAGKWVHLGMIETCAHDFRMILGSAEKDSE